MTIRAAVLRVPVVVDLPDTVLITVEMGNSDVMTLTQMVADSEVLGDKRKQQIRDAASAAADAFRARFLAALEEIEAHAEAY